jgi:hypothetical protein
MKKYFVGGLLVIGVGFASFAQDNSRDSLNQNSNDARLERNSVGKPEQNPDQSQLNRHGEDENLYSSSKVRKSTSSEMYEDSIAEVNSGQRSEQEPDLTDRDSIYQDNNSANSKNRINSPEDNRKDEQFYEDSTSQKKKKTSKNMKSSKNNTGDNQNSTYSSSKTKSSGKVNSGSNKSESNSSPNKGDAVER